jgi:DNA-binding transcriptional LysR family regulator
VELRLLELFCHVYKARSFSRAARELGLTQPTVSAHIKDLEQQLGAPVFNRLGREIEATAAGRLLYEHSRPLLGLKRSVMEQMARFLGRIEGDLVVGASTVPGEYLLPGLLTEFLQAHPAVRLRLRVSDTAAALEGLRRGEIEAAVVGGRVPDRDLVFRKLADDTLVLAAPARPPWTRRREISLGELKDLPLLFREQGSGTREVLENAWKRRYPKGPPLRIGLELGSTAAVKEAVKHGHGLSFISALAIAGERAAKQVYVLRVRGLPLVRRSYYTVTDRRRVSSPAALALLDFLARSRPGA